jgi:hypothetical protein
MATVMDRLHFRFHIIKGRGERNLSLDSALGIHFLLMQLPHTSYILQKKFEWRLSS